MSRCLPLSALVLVLAACGPSADDPTAGDPAQPGAGDTQPPGSEEPGDDADGSSPGDTEGPGTEQPNEPVRTVLLIPGTTIVGSFFDDMAGRLTADGFEPVIYEPPDLFTESLSIGAERIADEVDRVLAATGSERLHIVAECNGGVATRYFLQVLGGHDRVDQVITFVSAHHGTWLSPLGDWVTGFDSLADIVPESPFLNELNAAPFPAGLDLTSIYTCNDEFMLPYDTSVVDGATNVLFCDHYLKHFDGFWDPVVYDRILLSLQGKGASAPTYY
jgi:triacylglycerol lipase